MLPCAEPMQLFFFRTSVILHSHSCLILSAMFFITRLLYGGAIRPRYRNDKQLVSQDFKSNTASYKYTFSIELVTVCKDDLVLFPMQVFNKCGVQSPLVICLRVSNCLTFLDPTTLITTQMESENYWRHPFSSVLSAKALVEYIVLDIEVLGPHHNGYQLADVQVARSSD
ncbi:hypothetical protein CYMTET_33963, partial [Cymbomonas tetramitiformis]